MKKSTSVILVCVGMFYLCVETNYFGANWFPKSPAVCDGIGLAIIAVGLVAGSDE